jgi:TPR repeat protein
MKRLIAGFILSWVFPFSYATASVDDLTARAESADAEAQFSLAQMYAKGEGVTKDDVVAAQWYSKAADLGHVEAKFELGRSYNGGRGVEKDTCRGLYYIQNAAELGNVDAQWMTGAMYMRGSCGQSDPARGLQWLELADANGARYAAGILWMYYFDGKYIEANHEKAVYWLKKDMATISSNFEMASVAFCMATHYYQGGPGLAQDDQQALNWFYISEKIANNRKTGKSQFQSSEDFYKSIVSMKEKVDPQVSEDMKAIASAAADDWWQQNSHQFKED